MWGIVALFDTTGAARVEGDVLTRMTRTLAHRGPDDFALHVEAQLGLGFTRLGIVDVDGGRQPLANEDGTLWLICNGEIFNHRELRRELEARGHVFSTTAPSAISASFSAAQRTALAFVRCLVGTIFHLPSRSLIFAFQFGRSRVPRLNTLAMLHLPHLDYYLVVHIWCKWTFRPLKP